MGALSRSRTLPAWNTWSIGCASTVSVLRAESVARFTTWLEALVIDWLQETSVSPASPLMGVNWNVVRGIMRRVEVSLAARRCNEADNPNAP